MPVQVLAPSAPIRPPPEGEPSLLVDAVVPTFNRPRETALLLADLGALEVPPGVGLRVLVVDNASATPASGIASPAGLEVRHLRLDANRGGSGGFNAGIAAVLSREEPGERFVWLLDSDARVERGALSALLRVMRERPEVVAAGSALCDPESGEAFELGGEVCRRTGELRQFAPGGEGVRVVEYIAACSLLVRGAAIARAGLLADFFVNGDDAEWCLRLARRTGGVVVAVEGSRVRHPRPDRMRTWDRFYTARNTFALGAAVGMGKRVRRRRACRELGRAASQVLVGRDDLAALHILGMTEALAGRVEGPGPGAARTFEPFTPLPQLAGVLRMLGVRAPVGVGLRREPEVRRAVLASLAEAGLSHRDLPASIGPVGVGRRLLLGPPARVAIVSARARPADWLAGRVLITACAQGFAVRRLRGRAGALAALAARGWVLADRLARRGPGALPAIEPAPTVPAAGDRADLAVVILAHNRPAALRRTLRALASDPLLGPAHTVVVDNASRPALSMQAEFPRAEFVRLGENTGVGGFHEGMRRTRAEFVLLLDDDAIPDPPSLRAAFEALRRDPGAGAATLHPRHPWTNAPEWPFAAGPSDRWPVMGCANIVRREAWDAVGGYERGFFLYRNDTDLALKMLASGRRVLADSAWTVWHDSPGAARKSDRWFHLATRNWVWLCRRHGRGALGIGAGLLGWAWAHRLAGPRPGAHAAAIRGGVAGVFHGPPPLPGSFRADSDGLRRLLGMRLRRGQGRPVLTSGPAGVASPKMT